MSSPNPASPYPGARLAVLGVLAVLILLPVTLPVTVLRGLVEERFGASEFVAEPPPLEVEWDDSGPAVAPRMKSLVAPIGRAGIRSSSVWRSTTFLCP